MDAREVDMEDEAPALVTWEVTIAKYAHNAFWYQVGNAIPYLVDIRGNGVCVERREILSQKPNSFTQLHFPTLKDAHDRICFEISAMVTTMDGARGLVAVKFPPCPEVEVE